MEISVIVGQDVGWVGMASGEPGSTKSGAGGAPALVPLAAAMICSSNRPREQLHRSEEREFLVLLVQRDSRFKTLGPEQLLRARLLVCVFPCNAACTSISFVGVWLLHSCPVLQCVWGKVGRKVTSKDTFPSWKLRALGLQKKPEEESE